jgi:hypothetical protein
VADFTRELYRLLGITVSASTAYHPQTDGQTERVNQELEIYLRMFTNERHSDWNELLPSAEFAYNNAIHSSTQQTPFLLDTGCHPRMGFEPRHQPSEIEGVNEFVDRMRSADEEAQAAITKAKDDYTRFYNQRHGPTPVFKPGDKVWLDASDIQKRLQTKFTHLRMGPFEVERAVSSHAYRLKLPKSMSRVHPVFPVVKLELAPPNPIPGRVPPPPPKPDLIDGHHEFEVQEILDSRVHRRNIQFKVWYRGYPRTSAEWVPATDAENAQDKVHAFFKKHPQAAGRDEWYEEYPVREARGLFHLPRKSFVELWGTTNAAGVEVSGRHSLKGG